MEKRVKIECLNCGYENEIKITIPEELNEFLQNVIFICPECSVEELEAVYIH